MLLALEDLELLTIGEEEERVVLVDDVRKEELDVVLLDDFVVDVAALLDEGNMADDDFDCEELVSSESLLLELLLLLEPRLKALSIAILFFITVFHIQATTS